MCGTVYGRVRACRVRASGWGAIRSYKFDLGVELGMSGYIGDANSSNIFRKPGFDGELSFRYIGDTRWAVRGVFSTFSLNGDTSGMDDVLPGIVNPETGVTEPAFLQFRLAGLRPQRPWRVQLLHTVSARHTSACAAGRLILPWAWVYRLPLQEAKTYAAPVIPMGFGVKYKLAERWNLGLEFTMTKAFNDHYDSAELADLNQIKTAFYKSTDWYSRLTIGVSYEFGKRCETCHYVD